jgi:DnaJ-class molecular chaperone
MRVECKDCGGHVGNHECETCKGLGYLVEGGMSLEEANLKEVKRRDEKILASLMDGITPELPF